MKSLSMHSFHKLAGTVFTVIAVVHGLRLINGWGVVFNGWTVPMWVSGVAVVLAAYLACSAFKLMKK